MNVLRKNKHCSYSSEHFTEFNKSGSVRVFHGENSFYSRTQSRNSIGILLAHTSNISVELFETNSCVTSTKLSIIYLDAPLCSTCSWGFRIYNFLRSCVQERISYMYKREHYRGGTKILCDWSF